MQRLVLILPVEDGDQHNLPGGKAGGIQAPPDEVSKEDQVAKVKHISGLYNVGTMRRRCTPAVGRVGQLILLLTELQGNMMGRWEDMSMFKVSMVEEY